MSADPPRRPPIKDVFVFGAGAKPKTTAPPVPNSKGCIRSQPLPLPSELNRTKKELADTRRELETQQSLWVPYKEDKERMTSELSKLQANVASLEAKLKDREAHVTYTEGHISDLEEQFGRQKGTIRDAEAEIAQLKDHVTYQATEISVKDTENQRLKDTVTSLQTDLDHQSQQLSQETAAKSDAEASIDRLNADINEWEERVKQQRSQATEWQLKYENSEEKLRSLRGEWEEQQDEIETLQVNVRDLMSAENMTDELMEEVNSLKNELSEKDQIIVVKDARIQGLEADYQKLKNSDGSLISNKDERINELERELQKAMGQTLATTGYVTNQSLEDEFAGKDAEFEQEDEEFEEELSMHYQSFVDVPPIETQAPRLSQSQVLSTIDYQPVDIPVQQLTALYRTMANIAPIASDLPHLQRSSVRTTIDDAPVEPEVAQLQRSSIVATIDDAPIAPTTVTPVAQSSTQRLGQSSVFTIISQAPISWHPATVTLTKLTSKVLPYLMLLLLMLCFYLYRTFNAWDYSNPTSIGRNGAFGNGRHFMGVVPVGYGVGETALAENVARFGSMFVQSAEQWAGIDRSPYF